MKKIYLGADEGLNEIELQAITGHKNLESLKVYVGSSKVQKLKASNALSLQPKSNNNDKENKDNRKRKKNLKSISVKKGRGNIEIVLNNSKIANVNIKQHEDDNCDDDYE